MDGDGSIQVNHWRKKNLQYRLIIKLKFNSSNLRKLNQIKEIIGGRVVLDKNQKFISWVTDNKKEIIHIIKIFDNYPPLTSRLICCLIFLKTCLKHNNVDLYLSTRNNKYIEKSSISSSTDTTLSSYPYFNSWLSGFIEAEGCFCLRANTHHSFSIGQNDDYKLLELIKFYFNANNKIMTPYKDKKFFSLEVYKKEVLLFIINHCDNYPL